MILEQGGLILLDGLDEVPEADRRRAQIRDVVSDLAGTCRKCRILVTSRTYAYQNQEWKLPGFADAVDLLLDRWESQRVVNGPDGKPQVIQPSLAEWLQLDRNEVRGLIHRLAFEAHPSQPSLVGTADIPEKDLVAGLMDLSHNPDAKPKRLVECLSLRAGLLLPHGVGVYTFAHRTFQEYLAACHLTDQDFPDHVAELARSDPGRWREAVLLVGAKAAAGTASAIWTLADALCYREPGCPESSDADTWGALLAGQALAESADLARVSARNAPKLDRARRGLVRVMEGGDLPAVERALAGRVLAKLGDPWKSVTTVEAMELCWVPGGPFWMGEGKDLHENDTLAEG